MITLSRLHGLVMRYSMDNNIANTINGTGQGSCYAGDMNAGYLESRANESGNDYAFGRVQSVASGNGWGFSGTFRRANILLANIDKSEMTDAERTIGVQ